MEAERGEREMKKRSIAAVLIVAMMIVLAGPLTKVTEAYTVNKVYLSNNESFDITSCPKNTIIFINDDTASRNNRGEVTLSGVSSKVWVDISLSKGKFVNVKLADGLTITPDSSSAYGLGGKYDTLGNSRSAIYIDETDPAHSGGIVQLESKKGATIRLDSYQQAFYQPVPAIMKNNTKTKLIFSTEDRSNPGTIIAKPTSGGIVSGSVAIGAYGHGVGGKATSSYTVGNMEFRAGNIEAYGLSDGPGIGAYFYSNVGEIEFNGAHVIAKAGNSKGSTLGVECGAAGIGSCIYGDVGTIYINSGYVEAWGRGSTNDENGWPLRELLGYCGPGIGAGPDSHLDEILITGGTVVAYGGTCDNDSSVSCSGSGIGTSVYEYDNGQGWSSADKITITGGNIKAYGGSGACGIGGCVGDIRIEPDNADTELKINAQIDLRKNREGSMHAVGAGIGINNNHENSTFSKFPGNITIKGGDITARSAHAAHAGWYGYGYLCQGAGIGAGHSGRVSSISISGGKISAYGGYCSPGIGGHSVVKGNSATVDNIHISGGTITATKAVYYNGEDLLSGIGGCKKENGDRTDVVITGGSVISNGTDYAIGYDAKGQPKNGEGKTLTCTKFNFTPDTDEWTRLDTFSFSPSLSYTYGLNDIYIKKGLDGESDENLLAFWLPGDGRGYNCIAETGERGYVNKQQVVTGQKNTLYGYTDITYVNRLTGETYSGKSYYGDDKLSMDTAPPQPQSGVMKCYSLHGYKDKDGRVAVGGYGETHPSLKSGTQYVDKDGKWNAKYGKLTLDLDLEQTKYLVSYDKNKPANASHDVAGEKMPDSLFNITGSSTLTENAYSLTGWEFKGWNTKKDGTGIPFGNNGEISYQKDWGDHVTLYAQWKAKTYTITYDTGDKAAGEVHTQQAVYDTPSKLDRFSDSWNWTVQEGYVLHGWTTDAFGSFYEDGEDFCNLCSEDGTSGYTLTAEWAGSGSITVTATVDGVPTYVSDSMQISSVDSSSIFTMTIGKDQAKTGRYTASLSGLSAGDYQLSMDGQSGKYTIPADKQLLQGLKSTSAVSVVLDYYTVTMHKDVHVSSANVKETGTGSPAEEMEVPDETDVVIESAADNGYHFDGYSYFGVQPTWDPEDPSKAVQTITVHGKMDITAHAEANVYHVTYDKNKPANASHEVGGSMADQDFVYDEPQKLKENGYTLTGWTFKGWNTKADGTGAAFAGEELMDSGKWDTAGPPDNGADVTLYAQWEPNTYKVYFSATNATSGTMGPQTFRYDTPQKLSPNAFMRTDWHFMGWNTEPSGGGTSFENEEEVCNLTTGTSITIYAQWEHDYYTVLFDKNDTDAEGEMPEEHVWTNCGYELPLCGFYKTGYSFASWNTKADGSGKSYEDGEVLTNAAARSETMTLYAQWKVNSYTVRFDPNTGGGSMADQKFVYDVPQTLNANGFKKAHYIFTGWNTHPDGTGKPYADRENVKNITAEPDGVVTLYAQWEIEKHTISYDLNGGTLDGKTGIVEVSCSYGDTIILPKPEREGYTFRYWKGSRYMAGAKYTVKEDHTLTAQWGKEGVSTGDENSLTAWIMLFAVSASGLFIGMLRLRRR